MIGNHMYPLQKLISKFRDGAKLTTRLTSGDLPLVLRLRHGWMAGAADRQRVAVP